MELDPTEITFHNNLSAVYFEMKDFPQVLMSTSKWKIFSRYWCLLREERFYPGFNFFFRNERFSRKVLREERIFIGINVDFNHPVCFCEKGNSRGNHYDIWALSFCTKSYSTKKNESWRRKLRSFILFDQSFYFLWVSFTKT